MPLSPQFEAYVLEQLGRVARITPKRMFGGVGVYAQDAHFAILQNDIVYLRVDDNNRADFEAAGMQPLRPYAGKPTLMPYFELPAEVLEDEDQLRRWVAAAIRAAVRAQTAKNPR
jgi:DNA transformation protein